MKSPRRDPRLSLLSARESDLYLARTAGETAALAAWADSLREERVAVGGLDVVLASEGEEPLGRLEPPEVDRLAEVGGELDAEAAGGVALVVGERARLGRGDGDAGREVDEPDTVGGLLALLSTGTAGAKGVPAALDEEGGFGE